MSHGVGAAVTTLDGVRRSERICRDGRFVINRIGERRGLGGVFKGDTGKGSSSGNARFWGKGLTDFYFFSFTEPPCFSHSLVDVV